MRPTDLLRSHGPLRARSALAAAVAALVLAALCLLAVLAFHFPEYLTTPELRRRYDVALLRELLLGAMLVSGGLSLANLLRGQARRTSAWALTLVAAAALLGGHRVEVDPDFPDHTPYIGLDWFILDLLGSAIVFIAIEKLWALRREQPVFRPAWQTDLAHFAVNHLLVGLLLVLTNTLVHHLFGWAAHDGLRGWVQALPLWAAVPLALLVADLAQYTLHRAYHRVPWLWRFHAVHHSIETLDWLAGSRMHLAEVLATRTLVLGLFYVAGFSRAAIDIYIVIVGFQAVFNHANVRWPVRGRLARAFGWLIVTPAFHHWHHSREAQALDRNFAAHFAFIDHLLGTAARTDTDWPREYGTVGNEVPEGFIAQTLYPLRTRP